MFSRNEVSVFGWIMFYIMMAIPLVNIIFWIVLLFGSSTNKTLKNLLVAQIVAVIVVVGLVLGLGVGATFIDTLLESIPV